LQVLLRGCRCVEIDVWDGNERKFEKEIEEEKEGIRSKLAGALRRHRSDSPSNSPSKKKDSQPTPWTTASMQTRAEPRVLHGHTLTKEVPFRDVCNVIKEAAFASSDLPVIVSLEVHAGEEQQQIMVDIMEECWAGHLIQIPTDDCKVLPSPDSLRRKILVKVKGAPINSHPTVEVQKAKSDNSSSSEDEKGSPSRKKKKKRSIIENLSKMGKYTQSFHFNSLTSPEALIPTHVFSLSEKKLMGVHVADGPTIFSHNKNFLMRAFPSGKRIASSNLDPSIFWRKGVQMVALNWQKFDAGSMLNEAQFSGTGGWVLKPEGYRGTVAGNYKIGTETQANAVPRKKLGLRLEILAAQHLPLKKGETKGNHINP
jgi:hypothetical protein